MKRFSLLALAAGIAVSSWAVPARQGVRTMTQPDGSKIQLTLVGDEFSHNLIDSEGRIVKRGADGFYRAISQAEVAERHAAGAARRNRRNLPTLRAAQENQSQVPHIGSPRVPVLLVQYSDYKFKDNDPKATFNSFFAEGATSAHQYFVDQSNGKFTPQFDVYGPITLTGKRADYGGNDYWGNDEAVGRMVAEGCLGLDSSVDFSKYDNDGDGECDVVIVLYAGDGEASSYDDNCEDSVWPCQWQLDESDYGKALTLDSTKVNLFAVFNELYGQDLSQIDGIGTFCHEFSHCLGLPDFYDTQYGPHFGMGNWSLMDNGSYNDDGFTPIGYSAYEKEFMGWIEIPEAEPNTLYTLTPMNLKSEATDMAVKVTNDADPNEYYILENRKKQGWDAYMPTEGMLITHFTYSNDAWTGNTVNDYDLQRATVIPADNSLRIDKQTYYGETYYIINEADLLGDLWPYGTATELTDSSTPAAKVNKGGYMSKPITEIKKNSDGTISFYAMKGALPALDAPSALSHSVLSTTSAAFSWECGDENVGSYNLEVAPYIENPYVLLNETSFATENNKWTTTGYTSYEENAIRIGSSKQNGTLTSPSLTANEDYETITVKFSGKYWSGDNSSVRVSLLNSNGTALQSEDIALGANYSDRYVTFSATPGMSFKVKFEMTASKKRFWIQNVAIYSGEYSADAARMRAPKEETRLFTGITAKNFTVTGLTENAKYEYRVQAVPADAESFNTSAWTKKVLLDLSVPTGVSSVAIDTDAAERWITLQGVQLPGRPSAPGIYLHVAGGKTEKVIIR